MAVALLVSGVLEQAVHAAHRRRGAARRAPRPRPRRTPSTPNPCKIWRRGMKVLVDRRHAAEKLVVEGVVTQAGCVLEAGDEGSVWKWRPAQHAGEEGELVWLQARYVRPAPVGATTAIEVDLIESDAERTQCYATGFDPTAS